MVCDYVDVFQRRSNTSQSAMLTEQDAGENLQLVSASNYLTTRWCKAYYFDLVTTTSQHNFTLRENKQAHERHGTQCGPERLHLFVVEANGDGISFSLLMLVVV